MIRGKTALLATTISHMLNHRALISVLILMMSLIFVVQLMLTGRYDLNSMKQNNSISLQKNTYGCLLSEANKDQVEDFLSEIQAYKSIIGDVIISSDVVFPLNESLYENVESDTTSSDVEEPVHLITFFPGISTKRDIECSKGDSEFNADKTEIFLSDQANTVVTFSGNTTSNLLADTGFSVTLNDMQWMCIGVGTISGLPQELEANYVAVDFSKYSLAFETCDNLYILFTSKPTENELARINQIAEHSLPIQNPFQLVNGEAGNPDFFMEKATVIAVVLVLVINILALFDYLLSLRRKEFMVYLMLGSTMKTIWGCSLFELTITAAVSIILGSLVAVFPISESLFGLGSWNASPMFFAANAGAFLGMGWLGFALRMIIGKGRARFYLSDGGAV